MLYVACAVATAVIVGALCRAGPLCALLDRVMVRTAPFSYLLCALVLSCSGCAVLLTVLGYAVPPGGALLNVASAFLLLFHEGGHFFWGLSGVHFLMVLGGSLTELLIPLIFAALAMRRSYRLASSVALWSAALALADITRYVMDARAQSLTLISSVEGAFDNAAPVHDWNAILTQLGALEWCVPLGYAFVAVGILLTFLAAAIQVRAFAVEDA